MRVEGAGADRETAWIVDGEVVAKTAGTSYLWPVSRGRHRVRARVAGKDRPIETEEIRFIVK